MSVSEKEHSLDAEAHEEAKQDTAAEEEKSNRDGGHDAEHPYKEKKHKQVYDAFIAELEQISDPEAKLQKAIAFLESTLNQGGTPHFKSFWDVRTLCLELFKQNLPPASRAFLWSRYTELSKEARRLKEILEEQSAFAAEQIEIAVQALEKDIQANDEHLKELPLADLHVDSQAFQSKMGYYRAVQKELNLLNTQAARINALRKELMKTEMRIRQKNKFFQRLSLAGDSVFPRRKEKIKEASNHFLEDVDHFIQTHFKNEDLGDSLFYLREEIKALQSLAKVLTLNTHAFTHTRLRLSECWDKIKGFEKERKKLRAQQKAVYKDNVDSLLPKLAEFQQQFSVGELSIPDAQKWIEGFSTEMRQIELGRDEVKFLRDELHKAQQPLTDRLKKEEQERHQHELEKENQRRRVSEELQREVDHLIRSADAYEVDTVVAEKEALLEKIKVSPIKKQEKLDLEKALKGLRDLIAEKKEKALLSLSDDDRQMLQNIKQLLKEKRDRRQEIKQQIELLRKSKNSSGFDITQALALDSQMAEERERFEKINHSIAELEQRVDEIEG